MAHTLHVNHSEFHHATIVVGTQNCGAVQAVDTLKGFVFATHTKVVRKQSDASTTISAHCALATVRVVEFHFEIYVRLGALLQNHQSVGTRTFVSVTEGSDELRRGINLALLRIHQDEIISSSLVFAEL
jgi:hypothetical protein